MSRADYLSKEELVAYSRQIVLDEIGYEGQARLRQGRVVLAGVGGLGTPVALQLAAMGTGHLKIVDRDIVAVSDLHRQYIYDTESIGLPKVEAAAARLGTLNPRIEIEPVPISIRRWNVENLVRGADLVVDGLDSIETRYLINRACVKLGIPYVYCGAISSYANVTTIIPEKTPCLECFMPDLSDSDLPKCALVGVYTPVLGIAASIAVSEAVRKLTGKKPVFAGTLLYIDAASCSFMKVSISRDENCPVCGKGSRSRRKIDEKPIEEQCSKNGKRTFTLTPNRWLEIDTNDASRRLHEKGWNVEKTGTLGVTLKNDDGLVLCLMKTGVAVVEIPPARKNSTVDPAALFRELIVDTLKLERKAFGL